MSSTEPNEGTIGKIGKRAAVFVATYCVVRANGSESSGEKLRDAFEVTCKRGSGGDDIIGRSGGRCSVIK